LKHIIIFGLLLSPLLLADVPDCSEIPRTPTRIYFGNGIAKTRAEAQDALNDLNGNGLEPLVRNALPSFVDPAQVSFCLAYDRQYEHLDKKLDFVAQILDAAEQKGIEMSPLVLSWLFDFQTAPPFVQSIVTDEINSASEVFRPDLQRHVSEYMAQLAVGKAIVVAHSQGNFYANEAYDLLSTDPMHLSVIAVATPSDHVAGFAPGQGAWTTLHNDVITLTRLIGSLPPDWDNNPPCPIDHAIACHDFVASYLYGGHGFGSKDPGNTSGPRIVSQVIAALQPYASIPSAYTITDIGNFPEGIGSLDYSYGYSVNGAGQVAGMGGFSLSGGINGTQHAFLYTPGNPDKLVDIGTFPPFDILRGSIGFGINSSGQVTGNSSVGTIYTSSWSTHAFLYSGGALQDLGTLPDGTFSEGKGINDLGQVTGEADTSAGCSDTSSFNPLCVHAFVYTPAKGMKDIGAPAGFKLAYGVAINNAGQVTGYAYTASNIEHAFTYSPGTGMTDIGVPAGFISSEGLAINAAGQVTGNATTSSGKVHAFLYSNGQMTVLGSLPAGQSSWGRGINSLGEIVGISDSSSGETAFLYRPGIGMVNLNTLLPSGSGWILDSAYGISDAGQITGAGRNSNGESHAFLLSPVH
jgi:probable HAF family extracellular repeat protein